MKQRGNFDDDVLVHMKCLHPVNALSWEFHAEHAELKDLILDVPILTDQYDCKIIINIKEEWEQLLHYDFPEEIINEKSADRFWCKVKKCIDINGVYVFKNVAQFALDALCLPNSNAPSERTWSTYNKEKGKDRVSLLFPTIRAILLTDQYVKM